MSAMNAALTGTQIGLDKRGTGCRSPTRSRATPTTRSAADRGDHRKSNFSTGRHEQGPVSRCRGSLPVPCTSMGRRESPILQLPAMAELGWQSGPAVLPHR